MKATDAPIADELAGARRSRIKVGIGGWNFAPWRDTFYPKPLPLRRELEYASRHVTAIEINSTFYRAQKPAIYARWRDQTPAGFVFSLKAPRRITEHQRLADAGRAVHGFLSGGIGEFEDKLGPILWQLSPSRHFDPDDMAAFLELLPATLNGRALRHVLEVRHESFLCKDYIRLARRRRVPSVFTDSKDYPSFADLTGDFVYARLMRSRASIRRGYGRGELEKWAQRARSWSEGKRPPGLPHVQPAAAEGSSRSPRDVFVFFIGAAKQRNPAAAMALLDCLAA